MFEDTTDGRAMLGIRESLLREYGDALAPIIDDLLTRNLACDSDEIKRLIVRGLLEIVGSNQVLVPYQDRIQTQAVRVILLGRGFESLMMGEPALSAYSKNQKDVGAVLIPYKKGYCAELRIREILLPRECIEINLGRDCLDRLKSHPLETAISLEQRDTKCRLVLALANI
jgi:hypothetical protein